MAEVDDAGGLFCIAISEDEEELSKEKRNELSEEAFEALKASYSPLIENGEIWKTVKLPIEGSASKPQAQQLLHAIEELYFFRRYDEGAKFARRVLETSSDALDDEHRSVIVLYEEKCLKRMRQTASGP
ncbi:hypothetical protein B0T11DRAFT_85761 [Plectosphaerella cucumerina]|uniref:Uncharacterized protein n=1 Tax=Plectosphaerella cucumerina TaxID=40658 RepID=A0A8K0TFD9_9PEZI|nr:hypothetical protein B0T11DRAFT_85761 [Plectosphaerella cucumerina]